MKSSAAQVRAALDRAGAGVPLILLHGPDTGSAAALADRLAAAMGAGAERVDLDGATLRSDPARLADEVASPSLFGGTRWVRVSPAGDDAADAVALLLDNGVPGPPVLVLAPNVRATGRLAKLVLAHPRALALACYPLTGADLERRAAEMARERGLRLAPHVGARLVEASGGDQAVLARELDKLALYLDAAPDRPAELGPDALDALDAALTEAEGARLVDAAVTGDPAVLGVELARARAEGASAVSWLRALQRRLLSLAAMRAEVDRGEPAGAVMKRHRVFFREEAATAAALARWTAPALADALSRVLAAERAVTAPANAGAVLAEAAATDLARAGARRR